MRFSRGRAGLVCGILVLSLARAAAQAADGENPTSSAVSSSASQPAQSSIDDLFANPQADTETESSDAKQLLAPFHAQPLTVSGNITSYAGGVLGYTDEKNEADEYTGGYRFKVSPGMSFVPVLTFSARPDETLRFQGTVSFPFSSSDAFQPTINEMFFDYTLQDAIYMRIGKHLVSWGVTRIFGAGGDLMTSSDQDLNLKVTLPISTGGITGIVLAPSSIIDSSFSWRKLTLGGQIDLPYRRSEMILSSTCYGNDSDDEALHATAVIKTSLFGLDLFAEGVAASPLETRPKVDIDPVLTGIVSGFFWNTTTPPITLYGEYYVDATDKSWKSQFTSVVAKWNNAFGTSLDCALQWTHAYLDNSGIITPGFDVGILPHIKLQIGLPVRYGAPGSYYLENESPSVQTSVVKNDVLKWYQRYGLLIRLSMTSSF